MRPMPPGPVPPQAAPPGRARGALLDRYAVLAGTAAPRRRWIVTLAKRVLPALALGLLVLVALYPEISGVADGSRISYRRLDIAPEGGQLLEARYQGLDETGRPFTLTASKVRQVGPERTDLEQPKADITLESGSWLMIQARAGSYAQRLRRLDLAGEVTLYRDDGTTLETEAVVIDMNAAAAAGDSMVHAEGPFGVLDAQGFTLVDRGAVIHFNGPARIVLNGGMP